MARMGRLAIVLAVLALVGAACGEDGTGAPVVPAAGATIQPTPAPGGGAVWEWSKVDLDPAVTGRCASLWNGVWSGSQWVAGCSLLQRVGHCHLVASLLATGDLRRKRPDALTSRQTEYAIYTRHS